MRVYQESDIESVLGHSLESLGWQSIPHSPLMRLWVWLWVRVFGYAKFGDRSMSIASWIMGGVEGMPKYEHKGEHKMSLETSELNEIVAAVVAAMGQTDNPIPEPIPVSTPTVQDRLEVLSRKELDTLIALRIYNGMPYADLSGIVDIAALPESVAKGYYEELSRVTVEEGRAARKALKRARKQRRREEKSAMAKGVEFAKTLITRLGAPRTRYEHVNPEIAGEGALAASRNIHAEVVNNKLVITCDLSSRVAWTLAKGTYRARGSNATEGKDTRIDWTAKTVATTRDGQRVWHDMGPLRFQLTVRKHYGVSDSYTVGDKPIVAAPDQSALPLSDTA